MNEADYSASFFFALLFLVMTASAHIADRGGLRSRGICVFLTVIACVGTLLYFSGTFALLMDISAVLRSTGTNLRSVSGVAKFCAELRTLAENELPQMLVLITMIYLLLQTICIPGTVVLNAATGAIIGTFGGVLYCTLLGTVGAMSCYTLSGVVGVALVEGFDARLMKGKGLTKIRTQVSKYRSDLFVYLIFLRLTPIFPNWLINLASPMVGVPMYAFAAATCIGIIPQTYLTVRFGALSHVSADPNGSIVSVWDTLLLAVLGTAILSVFYLKKKFTGTNTLPPEQHSKLLV